MSVAYGLGSTSIAGGTGARETHVFHAQSQDMFALLEFASLVRLGAILRVLGWTKVLVGSSYELGEAVGGQCAQGGRLVHGGLLAIAMCVCRRR